MTNKNWRNWDTTDTTNIKFSSLGGVDPMRFSSNFANKNRIISRGANPAENVTLESYALGLYCELDGMTRKDQFFLGVFQNSPN